MDNLISRQAAIDVTNAETVSTNPDHFKAHEKFIQFMDDAEISSFGKWQWANGFNTALIAIKIGLEKLSSAQPERKKGKWIHYDGEFDYDFKCSECGYGVWDNSDFCPGCGCQMER